jgi:hypothetical protein
VSDIPPPPAPGGEEGEQEEEARREMVDDGGTVGNGNGGDGEPEPPMVTWMDRSSGLPGTVVTIEGTGFVGPGRSITFQLNAPGARLVTASVTWTTGGATVRVPALADLGSGGLASLVVQAAGGDSGPVAFTVLEPSPPAISRLVPPTALAGEAVQILGQGFGVAPFGGSVTFTSPGGTAIGGSVQSWSATRIVAAVPSFGPGGTGGVRVSTLWGTSGSQPLAVAEDMALPSWPVALLPVRVETRYAAGGAQLLVRIFPDDCAIDTHEPPLTKEERDAATAYKATAAGPARDKAWRDLVARYGPGRAEWLARALSGADPGSRDRSWTRAPVTRVMPTRWYALGYKGETRVFLAWGKDLVGDLAVGPDPLLPSAPVGGAVVDAGMRWMVDFNAAIDKGMALRVDLPAEARGRLDRVVVLGVKRMPSDGSAAGTLAALLTAHRYTRGLGFLPEGTPTNNSRERPAGLDSGALPATVAPGDPPVTPNDGSNRNLTARALGLDERVLGGIGFADHGKVVNDGRRAMNRVLWPATLGYFLEQLMAPAVSRADIERGRVHFVEWVRGCGPLPVLRIGNQPYGLLPVTPLRYWQSRSVAGDTPAGLVDLLVRAGRLWRDSLPQVPRVGRPGAADPRENLLATLAVQPLSLTDRTRHVLGRDYVSAAWRFLRQRLPDAWWQSQQSSARQVLAELGLPWHPRLEGATYTSEFASFPGPRVQGQPAAPEAPLPANYLSWLSATPAPHYRNVRDENLPQLAQLPAPRPLLYLLVRHGLLLQYVAAGAALSPPDPAWREEELVDVDEVDDEVAVPRPPTPWDRLAAGGKGRVLDDPAVAALRPFRDGLRTLAPLSVGTLERLLAETLDVCSHRWDAWVTSVAWRRLADLRPAQAFQTGLHLGGWGAVLDLEPAGARPLSEGYVQAPSLLHASTAAVLASGYLSHQARDGRHPLAVDLSSARAAAALRLLQGVRQGQPLGALLGYRFERGLHERGVARYLDEFRAFAPMAAGSAGAGGAAGLPPDPVEGLAVRNVVDGLELQRRWVAAGRALGAASWPVIASADSVAVAAALNALDEAVDAVTDALLAEGVFHAASGNPVRAAAALDAASGQAALPAELEVARTPRTGITVTHRLVALVPDSPSPPAGWPAPTAASPRRQAEPRLDALAATLLPPPSRATCDVEYVERLDGIDRLVHTRSLRLNEVTPALSALDVVFAAEAYQAGQASELEQRFLYHAARTPPPGAADATHVRLRLGANPPADRRDVPLDELLELARVVRELLAGSRALTAADLSTPERPPATTISLPEIEGRAGAAVTALRAAHGGLVTALGQGADQLTAALLAAAWYGVQGSVPPAAVAAVPPDLEGLRAQGGVVAAELARRVAAADAIPALPPTADQESRRDRAVALLAAVFGPAFRVLPLFTLDGPVDETKLDLRLPATATLVGGDTQAVPTWFRRAGRVRDGARRLGDALTYAESVTGSDALQLKVAQLPARAAERWVALPFAGPLPPAGRISFVGWQPLGAPGSASGPVGGLLLDQWAEVVPSGSETTAVAFHFDRPDATAPQSIVLAVPANPNNWSLAMLEATLLQTLDLAQARTVDLDALQKAGHFLPALQLAFNARGATVATDLKAGTGCRLG